MQAGLAQSRLPASAAPIISADSTLAARSRGYTGRGQAASSVEDAGQSGAPALLEPPQVQPLLGSPTGPVAGIGLADTAGVCDYWIVSSRRCNGKIAPRDAACCLEFYHHTADGCLVPRGREAFMASVRPDRPICFAIHGSYNYWKDVVTESQEVNRWIHAAAPDLPVQVVYFTWPSNGYMPFILPVDLAILGRRSAAHGAYLAQLITQLPPGQPVSIVGHSHGARTAAAALHALGGGTLEDGQALPCGFPVPERLRAVLLAAAIDHNWLNPCQRYGKALVVPERVLLMQNAADATLGLYPMRIGSGERALGKCGLGPDDRFALGPLGTKVVEFDVGRFTSWHHGFDNYHERPELAAALVPYVYFHDAAPATMGPAVGPPPFSAPDSSAAVSTTVRKVPTKTSPASPRVRPRSVTPEIWVEELPAPAPSRKPVELRFESLGTE